MNKLFVNKCIFLLLIFIANIANAHQFVSVSAENTRIHLKASTLETIVLYGFDNNKIYQCSMHGQLHIEGAMNVLNLSKAFDFKLDQANNIVFIETLKNMSNIHQMRILVKNLIAADQQIVFSCVSKDADVAVLEQTTEALDALELKLLSNQKEDLKSSIQPLRRLIGALDSEDIFSASQCSDRLDQIVAIAQSPEELSLYQEIFKLGQKIQTLTRSLNVIDEHIDFSTMYQSADELSRQVTNLAPTNNPLLKRKIKELKKQLENIYKKLDASISHTSHAVHSVLASSSSKVHTSQTHGRITSLHVKDFDRESQDIILTALHERQKVDESNLQQVFEFAESKLKLLSERRQLALAFKLEIEETNDSSLIHQIELTIEDLFRAETTYRQTMETVKHQLAEKPIVLPSSQVVIPSLSEPKVVASNDSSLSDKKPSELGSKVAVSNADGKAARLMIDKIKAALKESASKELKILLEKLYEETTSILSSSSNYDAQDIDELNKLIVNVRRTIVALSYQFKQ